MHSSDPTPAPFVRSTQMFRYKAICTRNGAMPDLAVYRRLAFMRWAVLHGRIGHSPSQVAA